MRRQRTIQRPTAVRGFGLISGRDVVLRFVPAPPGTGIVFSRTDLNGSPQIPARIDHRQPASRRTTLGIDNVRIEMTEHILAALSGLEIDNCFVELSAAEPPGCDGSSLAFADALLGATPCAQDAWVNPLVVQFPICVARQDAFIAVFPSTGDRLSVRYILDYTGQCQAIGRQVFGTRVTPLEFLTELAPSRTFLTAAEAAYFRHLGWGQRVTARDLLIFDENGPIENKLRYQDEPARHKCLDIVGDLALVGRPIVGSVVGYRSGHALNGSLAAEIAKNAASDLVPGWIWPGVLRLVSRSASGSSYVVESGSGDEAVRRGAAVLAALIETAGSYTGAVRICDQLAELAMPSAPVEGVPFEVRVNEASRTVRVVQDGHVLGQAILGDRDVVARAA